MGVSIHTQSAVALCLLVALVVLVVAQVVVKRARPPSSRRNEGGRTGREHVVWAATPLALGASFASALLVLVPFALASAPDSIPDSFLVPWVIAWGLVPCAVLGYLSGRWWSFLGALPMVVLWPFGLVVGSTSEDVLTNADLFFALPAAAAMAVALSTGSAVRCWRTRGIQPAAAVKADTTPISSVSEPQPNQPPFWPPPPGWKPTATSKADERKHASSRDGPQRREQTRSPTQPSKAKGFSVPSETLTGGEGEARSSGNLVPPE
jgi:hypothetical protein